MFFRITAKTNYCGEENEAVTAAAALDDNIVEELVDDMTYDIANEYWDKHEGEDGYEDFEDFLGDCYCDIEEIDEEEFMEEMGNLK